MISSRGRADPAHSVRHAESPSTWWGSGRGKDNPIVETGSGRGVRDPGDHEPRYGWEAATGRNLSLPAARAGSCAPGNVPPVPRPRRVEALTIRPNARPSEGAAALRLRHREGSLGRPGRRPSALRSVGAPALTADTRRAGAPRLRSVGLVPRGLRLARRPRRPAPLPASGPAPAPTRLCPGPRPAPPAFGPDLVWLLALGGRRKAKPGKGGPPACAPSLLPPYARVQVKK